MTNEQLCALAKQCDADAQNLLIENNLRFIKKTAYEVWSAQAELNRSLQISLDDLVQEVLSVIRVVKECPVRSAGLARAELVCDGELILLVLVYPRHYRGEVEDI